MKFPIGFVCDTPKMERPAQTLPSTPVPVKSLVQVYFLQRNQSYTYFNDRFDLKPGDFVFVDGKLEGVRGVVRNVSKSFKIKVSDYKKVIAVADTTITGHLHMAGSHFVSFDPSVLPYEKVRTWYFPPTNPEDVFELGSGDTAFSLNDLSSMNVPAAIWERGKSYYMENRVHFLCVEDSRGCAIVDGEHPYEVEFDFSDGEIKNLICSCPCSDRCKHQVAAMLQLKETLELIEKHYAHLYRGSFSAMVKGVLFRFAIDSRETGSFTL